MPLYRFTFTDGSEVYPDDEGVDLPNLEAAWAYALLDARDLIDRRMLGLRHSEWARWRVEITNGTGRPVMTVPFAEVMD